MYIYSKYVLSGLTVHQALYLMGDILESFEIANPTLEQLSEAFS